MIAPRRRLVFGLAVLLAMGGVTTAAALSLRGERVIQPLEFNHAVHIAGKVDCLQCHPGVLDPDEPALPPIGTCLKCHNEAPGDHPVKQKLAALAAANATLAWDPALRIPDHVFFSHSRHVEVANLECLSCHEDMPHRTAPPDRRRTIAMAKCIGCHFIKESPAAQRATLDCASCHR